MTDEEMAEEYCNNEVPLDTTESGEKLYIETDLKHAYLAGLNEGRTKWHDLRKDPNDLPTESMKPSLVKDEFGNLIVAYYSLVLKSWWSTPEPDFGIEYEIPVVRWKEIVLSKEVE